MTVEFVAYGRSLVVASGTKIREQIDGVRRMLSPIVDPQSSWLMAVWIASRLIYGIGSHFVDLYNSLEE